jgi:hypothetical protein
MNLLCENGVFTTMIIHDDLPASAINGRSANYNISLALEWIGV